MCIFAHTHIWIPIKFVMLKTLICFNFILHPQGAPKMYLKQANSFETDHKGYIISLLRSHKLN